MKKLIILNTSQFGSLTDSYKWCEYLRYYYDITFICFNNHWKRMDMDGVKYVYIYRFDNPVLRGVWYIFCTFIYCLFHRAPIFIVYFEHCSFLKKILPWKKMNVDIRTLAVSENTKNNYIKDAKMRKTIAKFDSVSFISRGVQEKLHVNVPNQYILPLGSDVICEIKKEWNNINLLYVGTLNHRDIIKTIIGFHSYIEKYGKEGISYDIIGDGQELQMIKDYISSNNLQDVVTIHGKLPYDELKPFFEKCNIGVSFVPIKECYQYQPPTKTFEYLLSGLYCIATSTIANQEVVTEKNGILIEDSSSAFSSSLEFIVKNKHQFDSKQIRDTVVCQYTWPHIINNKLIPILDNLY